MKDEASPQENRQFSSEHTSNDLLFRLDPDGIRNALNYEIVAQSAEEVQDVRNAPPFSIGPYLIESGQTLLLTTISIYSERGANREQVRLLYMNAVAVRIWKAMGRNPTMIGAQHRPPRTALLMYGVPFSE
jgi:adenylylsulfate kinase-like enzyme